MSRARALAKQADVVRAIKAAKLCGMVVTGVEVIPEGFRIVTKTGTSQTGRSSARADEAEALRRIEEAKSKWAT